MNTLTIVKGACSNSEHELPAVDFNRLANNVAGGFRGKKR